MLASLYLLLSAPHFLLLVKLSSVSVPLSAPLPHAESQNAKDLITIVLGLLLDSPSLNSCASIGMWFVFFPLRE